MQNDIMRRTTAEFFGTFWLTFAGCGAAVLAAAFPSLGIGFLGVSLAFGLTVSPWPTRSGIFLAGTSTRPLPWACGRQGRCANRHVLPYVIAQVVALLQPLGCFVHRLRQGGLGCWWLCIERLRRTQPGKYSLAACFATEVLLTFFFIFIIVGTTRRGPP